MKLSLPVLLTLSAALSAGQAAPAQSATPPDPKRVVAIIEGKPWTADDLERMTSALGGAILMNFNADPKGFAETLGLLFRLESMADQEKMAESDPHKWRLLHNRAIYLAQARMNAQSARHTVLPDDQKKYFELHKAEFSNAKVRVILLKSGGKRSDAETQQLADDIVKQTRAGADFAPLVQKYSDDPESKAKGGDYPPVKPGDSSLPTPIKTAIFALQPGQVSDPIRQPAGLWIFRLDEFAPAVYEEVKDAIFTKMLDEVFKAWMDGVRKSVQVEIKDPAYFTNRAGAAQPPVPSPAPAKP